MDFVMSGSSTSSCRPACLRRKSPNSCWPSLHVIITPTGAGNLQTIAYNRCLRGQQERGEAHDLGTIPSTTFNYLHYYKSYSAGARRAEACVGCSRPLKTYETSAPYIMMRFLSLGTGRDPSLLSLSGFDWQFGSHPAHPT